jgi:hypothetical protein
VFFQSGPRQQKIAYEHNEDSKVDMRVTDISAAIKLSNTMDRIFVKNAIMVVMIPEEGTVINFLNSLLIVIENDVLETRLCFQPQVKSVFCYVQPTEILPVVRRDI